MTSSTSLPEHHEHQPNRYLGPTMPEFLGSCWATDPVKFGVVWSTGWLCFLITLVLVAQHVRSLLTAPACAQRSYYVKLALMPLVFALTAALMLLDPATWPVFKLVQTCYEAYGLTTFGAVLFMLLVHESVELQSKKDGTPDSGTLGLATAIQVSLADQGKKKHFAVPPCCCFFFPCMQRKHLTVRNVFQVMWFIKQYVYLAPLLNIIDVWAALALPWFTAAKLLEVLKLAGRMSSLLCLYGLFVLYKATRELLHEWRTTTKFVALKLILIIFALQEMLTTVFLEQFLRTRSQSCFRDAGFSLSEWYEVEGRFWGMWLIALETVGMSLLLRRAFPACEILVATDAHHHSQLEASLLKGGDAEASGEESSDEADDEEAARPRSGATGASPAAAATAASV